MRWSVLNHPLKGLAADSDGFYQRLPAAQALREGIMDALLISFSAAIFVGVSAIVLALSTITSRGIERANTPGEGHR